MPKSSSLDYWKDYRLLWPMGLVLWDVGMFFATMASLGIMSMHPGGFRFSIVGNFIVGIVGLIVVVMTMRAWKAVGVVKRFILIGSAFVHLLIFWMFWFNTFLSFQSMSHTRSVIGF
jgi:hypothetical protein